MSPPAAAPRTRWCCGGIGFPLEAPPPEPTRRRSVAAGVVLVVVLLLLVGLTVVELAGGLVRVASMAAHFSN